MSGCFTECFPKSSEKVVFEIYLGCFCFTKEVLQNILSEIIVCSTLLSYSFISLHIRYTHIYSQN